MRHANSMFSLILLAVLLAGGFFILQQQGGTSTPGGMGSTKTACPAQPSSIQITLTPQPDTLPSGQQRNYRLIIQNPMGNATTLHIRTSTLHPDVSTAALQTSRGGTQDITVQLPEGLSEGVCMPSQDTLLLTLTGRLPPLLPRLDDELHLQTCYTVEASMLTSLCALPPGSIDDPTGSICTPGAQQVPAARVPLSLVRVEDFILTKNTKDDGLTAGFRLVFTNAGGGVPFIYAGKGDGAVMDVSCTLPEKKQNAYERESPAIRITGTLSGKPITCTPRLTLSRQARQTEQGLVAAEYSTSCTADLPELTQPGKLLLTLTYAYAYEPPIIRIPFTLIK